MVASVRLPKWLDKYIYDELGAKYCRTNSDMTVIDWDKSDVLNYLGTYFPRSYAEAYCIYRHFFSSCASEWETKQCISIFDFGCGTGGEIIGLLTAIDECLHGVEEVDIYAMDGNFHALRLFEKVLEAYSSRFKLEIKHRIVPVKIDDIYDLTILDEVVQQKFDIVMSVKAICEFVSKDQFEKTNAYECVARYFLPKLNSDGIMLLVDVTTYSNVSQEWLPKMMDRGLSAIDCRIMQSNEGYNQMFTVTHSHCVGDKSKVAWRIINNR